MNNDDKKLQTAEFHDEIPLDMNAPLSSQLSRMTAADWRRQFVEDHTTCVLCGLELSFSHQTNFSTLEVEEEAHCLACKMHAKTHHYFLQ